ncbi:MAG: hypothetical protein JO197_12200 [Acidobacteria bacterium]|nr:hypothetical protein [Acidobacteriota bacterium]MBV9475308.1 hypothetical protein [Acidobacteriota bacterium]
MSDAILAAAEELKRKIDEKVMAMKADPSMAEVLRLQQGLNALEEIVGQPKSTLAQLFGLDAPTADSGASGYSIRPDEYYGLDGLDAAKRYLKRRGQARPFREIVEAIRRGGCKVDNESELKVRMARSTYEVAVLPDEHYGLVEFYPHLKRGKGTKKRAAGGAAEVVSAVNDPANDDEEHEEENASPAANE